jgi:hypothetical protein
MCGTAFAVIFRSLSFSNIAAGPSRLYYEAQMSTLQYCAECIVLRDALIDRLTEYASFLQLAIRYLDEKDDRLAFARQSADKAAQKTMTAKGALEDHMRTHPGKAI